METVVSKENQQIKVQNKMPGQNRKGPEGQGPKTGRGQGLCSSPEQSETNENQGQELLGRGRGRAGRRAGGMGRQGGRGFGGGSRGRGQGFGQGNAQQSSNSPE